MLKAVADERGLGAQQPLAIERGSFQDWLRRPATPSIARLYRVASALHANFYEGWLTEDFIEAGLQDVTRFIEKLEALLDQVRGGAQ